MPNPKPGAHKPRYYLTTFPPCLEGKTVPRAGHRWREFLPQVSCVAEEHFQRFPFFFFLPRCFSWRRKTERKPQGENNPPAPPIKLFSQRSGVCGWVPRVRVALGTSPKLQGRGFNPFFWGAILHLSGGGLHSRDPRHRSSPVPCPARDPGASPGPLQPSFTGAGGRAGVAIPPVSVKVPLLPQKNFAAPRFWCWWSFPAFFFFPSMEAGGEAGRKSGLQSPAQSGA